MWPNRFSESWGLFGARRGPYRILYAIDDEANRVEVLRLDHRSDVYRSE